MDSTRHQTWMRPALAYLFDHCATEHLTRSVRDPAELSELRRSLVEALPAADRAGIPVGEKGDNLILALVALRLKFSRPEAEQKLERNLQLRQQV